MITGDYGHTAVAVAKSVGMVKADGQVVIIDTVHREAARLGTPSSQAASTANSSLATPNSSPKASLRQMDAELARGFFGLSLGPREASLAAAEAQIWEIL